MATAVLDSEGFLHLPPEVCREFPNGQVFDIERVRDGILLRPRQPLKWEGVFDRAVPPRMAKPTDPIEVPEELTGDDYVF